MLITHSIDVEQRADGGALGTRKGNALFLSVAGLKSRFACGGRNRE